jgi:glucoamylase
MNSDKDGLLAWARSQSLICVSAILRSVSATSLVKHRPALGQTIHPARGSILASPELAAYDPYPDYFFHWLRDSAIVADGLREAIEAKILPPSATQNLADFVDFSLGLCRSDGPSFLRDGGFPEQIEPSFAQHVRALEEISEVTGDKTFGEPRYNADGSFDVMKWARPQNDGPALRALTVMRFFSLDGFSESAGEAARKLLRHDLDYIHAHWREPCFDLWEEESGYHYHTRLVHYAALDTGSAFMQSVGEMNRAMSFADSACQLLAELDAHFESEDGVYRGRLTEGSRATSQPRRLDISVILAVVQTNRRFGAHSVVDPRMLATMSALEGLFEQQYLINRTRPAECAPALGRYEEDSYFSGGAYYFSTLGAAQFYFLLAEAIAEEKNVEAAEEEQSLIEPLNEALGVSCIEAMAAQQHPESLAEAALCRGDMFLTMVRLYTPASGELSEQFDQNDGAPASARNLSWSYAAFLTACAARQRAVRAIDFIRRN